MKTRILLGLSAFTFAMVGCAHHKNRTVANTETNNMVVIPAGAVENEGYSWMSSYVIDRATKECYTQLSMYSVIKTDCAKLKALPEANKVLKEIGL